MASGQRLDHDVAHRARDKVARVRHRLTSAVLSWRSTSVSDNLRLVMLLGFVGLVPRRRNLAHGLLHLGLVLEPVAQAYQSAQEEVALLALVDR